jgi:hypothetical protein
MRERNYYMMKPTDVDEREWWGWMGSCCRGVDMEANGNRNKRELEAHEDQIIAVKNATEILEIESETISTAT